MGQGGARNTNAGTSSQVRRLRGQLESVERALEDEKECGAVLQVVASARGALNGLVGELIEDHVRSRVGGSEGTPVTRKRATDELVEILRTYLKRGSRPQPRAGWVGRSGVGRSLAGAFAHPPDRLRLHPA